MKISIEKVFRIFFSVKKKTETDFNAHSRSDFKHYCAHSSKCLSQNPDILNEFAPPLISFQTCMCNSSV